MKQIHFTMLAQQAHTLHQLYEWGWLPWAFQRFMQKSHIRMEAQRTFYNFCKELRWSSMMVLYSLLLIAIAHGLLADRVNVHMLLSYVFAAMAINHLRFEYRWFLRFTNQ